MEIILKDIVKLSQIQEMFNAHFPYLKIVFYNFDSTQEKIFSNEHVIEDSSSTLGEIRTIDSFNTIDIDENQKTKSFEEQFLKKFGIYIQVFRKSANLWLLTEATDEWSLTEQNSKGKEMNKKVEIAKIDDFEYYHEQL
jgi:hypothetical protein